MHDLDVAMTSNKKQKSCVLLGTGAWLAGVVFLVYFSMHRALPYSALIQWLAAGVWLDCCLLVLLIAQRPFGRLAWVWISGLLVAGPLVQLLLFYFVCGQALR